MGAADHEAEETARTHRDQARWRLRAEEVDHPGSVGSCFRQRTAEDREHVIGGCMRGDGSFPQ
jgi:hypothetical protein